MTKLLIIEHSKSVRNNLCERLEFEGYTTQSAECAEQVAATIEQGDIDLIITDDAATLPQTETPFIVISATSTLESALVAMRRGAVDFLVKPIDMNRLLAAIRSSVGDSSVSETAVRPARKNAGRKKGHTES